MKEFDLIKDDLTKAVNCLEASAGTGKTYALTWIYLRLLLEQNEKIDPSKILVVTFTKAATAELRDRIRKRLVEAQAVLADGKGNDEKLVEYFNGLSHEKKQGAANLLKNALEVFDLAAIYTIDSFCQRTLRDAAMESGVLFDLELIPNQADYVREVATDYCRQQLFGPQALLAGAAIQSDITPAALTNLLDNYLKHPELQLVTALTPRAAAQVDADIVAAAATLSGQWQALGGVEPLADYFATDEESAWAKNKHKKRAKVIEQAQQIAAGVTEDDWSPDFWAAVEYFCYSLVEKNIRAKQQLPANPPAAKVFFQACEQLSQLMAEHRMAHRLEFLRAARIALTEKKQSSKQASFSDQISRLREALVGPSGKALANTLRNRYQAALIDESQDTDPLQWEIFKLVFAEQPDSHWLYLIGDPKQAIYRFRGADVHTYLTAAASTRPDQRYTLGTNWRSESRLVHAVNAIFSKPGEPAQFPVFLEDKIQFKPVAPGPKADSAPIHFTREQIPRPAPLQVWKWEPPDAFVTADAARKRLPLVVAAEISRLLSGGVELGADNDRHGLQPRDIAVLVESHAQANLVQQALHDLQIPSVEKAMESVFLSGEANEMQWILQAVLNPGREAGVKAALTTDAMGISGNALSELVADENLWQRQLQKFVRYRKVWEEDGFYTMIREFIREEKIAESLLRFPNAERRLTNFMHVAEIMEAARKAEHLGPTRLVQWLEERRQGVGETPEDHQLRLESDEDAVQIVTMHSSKGLEYPVVFCPFHQQSAVTKYSKASTFYHDPAGELCWDIDPEPAAQNQSQASKENLADKVRLLYVALTRARNRCYLVSARYIYSKKNNPTALAWVMQREGTIPADPVEELKALPADWSAPWAEIKALADENCDEGEAIAVNDLPLALPGQKWIRADNEPATIAPRKCHQEEIKPAWYLTSFTGISSRITALSAVGGKDQKDQNPDDEVVPDRDAGDGVLLPAAAQPEQPPAGIFALPAGSRTGDCLHKILEQYDFQNPDEQKTRQLIQQQLESAALPAEAHLETVLQMLGRIRSLPLKFKAGDFKLADIPANNRLVEMEFQFPTASFQGQQLMEIIRGTNSKGQPAAAPDPRALAAYMKGFMDLVFEHEGRFHIIDWKSNWLGSKVADYDQNAMQSKIHEAFYDLQYHIYTVALDKFLRRRLPGYDYEKHFGGVHYLFLRGLDVTQPQLGVFHDRPAKAIIEQLSQLFEPAKA